MKISKYFLILIASISFSMINALEEFKISEAITMQGGRKFSVVFPDGNMLKCTSNSRTPTKKPYCIYENTTPPVGPWETKEVNWQNWYVLRELFDIQEKRAKEEMKNIESEFQKMKEKAESEAKLVDTLINRLTSSLTF